MKKLLSVVCLLVVACAVYGQGADIWKKNQNNTLEFGGTFMEAVNDPVLNKNVKHKGKIYFKSPRQMAIQYSEPAGDLFILNGMQMYIAKGKTKKTYDLNKARQLNMLANLLCYGMMGQISEIEKMVGVKAVFSEGKAFYSFKMTKDTKESRGYKQVELLYSKIDGHLSTIALVEFSGKTTLYSVPMIRKGTVNAEAFVIPTTKK